MEQNAGVSKYLIFYSVLGLILPEQDQSKYQYKRCITPISFNLL